MAVQDRETLKGFFETGDIPTQAQFADLIDSTFNLENDLPASTGVLVGFEISTGALVANETKQVTHNRDLSFYFMNVRSEDDENNAIVQILKPNAADPNNVFDIKVPFASTGLTVQILGIQAS